MCWFSAEYASKIEEAKAGQRLGIRTMHCNRNWVVRENELEIPKPCPICLVDGTRVVFRFTESSQALLNLGAEAEAVFKMLREPKRDIFEFEDGREIKVDDMRAGQILDVLVVPGSEGLSEILDMGRGTRQKEDEPEKGPLLARLLAHF